MWVSQGQLQASNRTKIHSSVSPPPRGHTEGCDHSSSVLFVEYAQFLNKRLILRDALQQVYVYLQNLGKCPNKGFSVAGGIRCNCQQLSNMCANMLTECEQ